MTTSRQRWRQCRSMGVPYKIIILLPPNSINPLAGITQLYFTLRAIHLGGAHVKKPVARQRRTTDGPGKRPPEIQPISLFFYFFYSRKISIKIFIIPKTISS